jgi:MAP7 domain-containing protein 1
LIQKAEEERAAKEEELRQARVKWEREREVLEEEEEEERRRAVLAEELRRATTERAKKEREMRDEEERSVREMEERKRREKERRLEDSRRSEEWRKERSRMAEETEKRKEEQRKQAEEEKRMRIELVKSRTPKEDLTIGWVTIQTPETLAWRRRYYQFVDNSVSFYRSPQDTHAVLEKIDIKGHLRGLKEWYEGYEELESIPNSFAIEFLDGQGSWSLFSDTEEDKIKFLGLLHRIKG